MLGFEPVPTAQNAVVLPTVRREPLEVLTAVSQIIELFGTTEIRTWTYCVRIFCRNATAEIYFCIKSLQKLTEKKEKRPY